MTQETKEGVKGDPLGFNFIKTGFKDYIASRFLLNNDFLYRE